MDKKKVYESLLESISQLTIIDTHEHLFGFESHRDKGGDFLTEYLVHYFNRDLVSAGAPEETILTASNPENPIMERWELLKPYWENVRYTGYGRALDISVKGIYDIDGIHTSTVEELNTRYKKALHQDGHYKRVLKDLCNIEVSILDNQEERGNTDPAFFRNAYRIDSLVQPMNYFTMKEKADAVGIPIRAPEDWIAVAEAILNREKERGMVALKCALAYTRSLRFDHVSIAEGSADFSWFRTAQALPDFNERPLQSPKAFQDMMMHRVLRWAEKNRIPIQIHTGYQESNGGILRNTDPLDLNNLFLTYEDLEFDLFHISYPFYLSAGALGKMFPNVYLDMCWAHILSPQAARNALSEWIETVPLNKINGFGGDYRVLDAVYGHLVLARRNIAAVLSEKIDAGLFDEDEALGIAEKLLYKNPASLFKLHS